jgi:glucose-6-phosphate isomerase
MDVGKVQHKSLLEKMHLLYGVVTYATGKMGKEPIRSQGHIHKVSNYSGWSTPEIYEIWTGEAIIYMQEYAEDNPGRCFAINAMPGEIVIVPPNWAHATISANPTEPLTFGAWCDRDYGFEYSGIRAHDGIAWFPLFNDNNQIVWEANPAYKPSKLIIKSPNDYPEFGIEKGKSIYEVFEENPDTFLYVPSPQLKKENWSNFEP